MKKLIIIAFALVAFASCTKQKSFEEFQLARIELQQGKATLNLDGDVVNLELGKVVTVKKDDYASIFINCDKCKVYYNGSFIYDYFKVK